MEKSGAKKEWKKKANLLLLVAISMFPFISFSQKPVFSVSGTVYETNTKASLADATIHLTGSDNTRLRITTGNDGKYYFNSTEVRANVKYNLSCTYTGWPIISYDFSTVNLSESKTFNFDFDFKFSGCKTLRFIEKYLNATFEFKSYVLSDQFKNELDKTVEILESNPTLTAGITGFIDANEKTKNDTLLPSKRVKAVYDYLILKGVNPKRLFPVYDYHVDPFKIDEFCDCGFEWYVILDSDFIVSLASAEDKKKAHKLNRRVEIEALRTDFMEDWKLEFLKNK